MIPLSNLYYVIIMAYLLQLYWNCSRLLRHIDCNSLLGHLLGYPLGYLLGHPLGHPLGYFLGYPI